jgi:Radical SAM superfamily/B12 binding domain
MDAKNTFLFLAEDPTYRAMRFPSVQESIGVAEEELLSLVFEQTGNPLFVQRDQTPDKLLTSACIAAILQDTGIPIKILKKSQFGDGYFAEHPGELAGTLAIGITTTLTFDIAEVRKLVDEVRNRLGDVPIILGGAGLTLRSQWFAESGADFGIVGDAEVCLPGLLRAIEGARWPAVPDDALATLPNLLWRRRDGSIARGPRGSFRLDDSPTPRYDLSEGFWPEVVYYESIRGCPFRCKFCSYPQQHDDLIYKSPEKMLDEFLFYQAQGVQHIACFDSTMLTPMARMKKLCRLLVEQRCSLDWSCYGHAAQLQSADFCRMLAQAGCFLVFVGIESGDEHVLEQMNKSATREKMLRAVRNVQEAGMLCITSLFIGFPGETPETAKNSLSFIQEAEPDFYQLFAFQIRDVNAPVIQEAERFHLTYHLNESGMGAAWSHEGMDLETASRIATAYNSEIILNADRVLPAEYIFLTSLSFGRVFNAEQVRFRKETIFPFLKNYWLSVVTDPDAPTYHAGLVKSRQLSERARARAQTIYQESILGYAARTARS